MNLKYSAYVRVENVFNTDFERDNNCVGMEKQDNHETKSEMT